jgi:hypothetical protein
MENRINIAKLLRNCPQGMELDCTSYSNVSFDKISDDKKATYPIFCYITDKEGNRSSISFTENGCESKRYGAKCVIFPKGRTTWGGFQRLFKDGDILATDLGSIFILKEPNENDFCYGCYIALNDVLRIVKSYTQFCAKDNCRLASEEEKQKLFNAIKDNGYKWNEETKTLEKLFEPKFKVGDIVQDKDNYKVRIFDVSIEDKCYGYESLAVNGIGGISFDRQDDWELVPNKFDITTLKPFESRVLVRNVDGDLWKPAIYGFPHSKGCYVVGGVYWGQCIPYEENKELLGTTNNPEEYESIHYNKLY